MSFKLGDDYAKEYVKAWNSYIRGLRWIGFALGTILIILGALCFVAPEKFAATISLVIAMMIVAFGVYRLVEYFTTPALFRFTGKLISGIFNLVVGYLLMTMSSEATVKMFTIIIAIDLVLLGIEKLALAMKLRFFNATNFGWLIADATITLICAAFFIFLPAVSFTVLGVFIGIYMVTGGASVLLECINAKEFIIQDTKKAKTAAKKLSAKEAEVVDKK